jgi:DNA-binding XRE family transcriptional regulator
MARDLGIDETQFRAIEMTIRGFTQAHIAKTLGVDRRTIWQWQNENFNYRRVLMNWRSQVRQALLDRYQRLLLKSIRVLAKLLDDPAADVQFRAAYALLSMSGAFRPRGSNWDDAPPEPILGPKVG